MVRRRGLAAASTLALLLPIAAQSPTALHDRLQRVLRDDRYQTELPGARHGTPVGPEREQQARSARADANRRRRSGDYGIPAGRAHPAPSCSVPSCMNISVPSIANGLFYALLAVFGVLLAVALVRALRTWRRTVPPGAATAVPVLPDGAAPPVLEDFERLALAGRFAEAVHAMLLHAFALLAAQRGRAWPRAETGREILAAVGGFGSGDAGLWSVFRTAEGSQFGGRAVTSADYDGCRLQFEGWRAAAGQATAGAAQP
jgi:hypothetical protein